MHTETLTSILIKKTVTGGFLNRFSRKERAKRKQQQEEQQHPQPHLRVPPAYKADLYDGSLNGPRSAHPRPLSSFAPDLSRQTHAHYPQQLPRASCDQPPLPTYDPSKYQPMPMRPMSIPSSDLLYTNQYASGQSSHLSAVHYQNARSSIYQPHPAPRTEYSAPRLPPYESVASARRQSTMPFPSRSTTSAQQRLRSEARERSHSEPMPAGPVDSQGTRGRRQKPVLSRLITNFG
ncbi:uncharacterized protein N7483_005826 [Penicillium malachiteum]|uniref:uncharacterized protein n=1 Tax=Penicillium malachiteum TaxID=1324776 RepID=UPI0025478F19|nr:uncharacterized protein N7483_005826 [Penicillium malachiteum]KAJ5731318.1 hypothetical protein N7483_005826 [Penicillium malachiteum]